MLRSESWAYEISKELKSENKQQCTQNEWTEEYLSNNSTSADEKFLAYDNPTLDGAQWASEYLNPDIPFFSVNNDSKIKSKGEQIYFKKIQNLRCQRSHALNNDISLLSSVSLKNTV